MTHSIAFLIYTGVGYADFIGPYAIISQATPSPAPLALAAYTVGRNKEIVTLDNGQQLLPDHIYPDAHIYQAIVVPGGPGWQEAAANLRLLHWLSRAARLAQVIAAVGDGVRLVAAAGLLKDQSAAGNPAWTESYPTVTFVDEPLVDSGKFVTARTAGAGETLAELIVDRVRG